MKNLPHHPGEVGEYAAQMIVEDLAELGLEPGDLLEEAGMCRELTDLQTGEHLGFLWVLGTPERSLSYVVSWGPPAGLLRDGVWVQPHRLRSTPTPEQH